MIGMDQVNDAEGQDCGKNGHEGSARKQAEQRSYRGSENRTCDHSVGLRDRGLGKGVSRTATDQFPTASKAPCCA
jgi:hypothetical protein